MLQPTSQPDSIEQEVHPLLPPKPSEASQAQSRALAPGPAGPVSHTSRPSPQTGRARPKPEDMLEDRR